MATVADVIQAQTYLELQSKTSQISKLEFQNPIWFFCHSQTCRTQWIYWRHCESSFWADFNCDNQTGDAMKKRLIFLPLALLAGIACQGTTNPIISAPSSSSWVMGYYVGYLADKMPIEAIDWKSLTHLAVGIILPKSDGSLDFNSSIGFDAAKRALLIQKAHVNKRKVLAMIGGEATGPNWLTASSGANRATFLANLEKLVKVEGFDGLDLDWEPLEKAQEPVLLALTKDLRKALPNAVLTFPADGADNANFPADQINAMTYGMSGAYDGWKTWHSSPLYPSGDSAAPTSVELTVKNYLKAGIPAAKLGIGIGFYGQCYGNPATKPLEDTVGIRPDGAKIIAGDNDLSYTNIVTTYEPLGTKHWDATARVPYLSFAVPSGVKGCTYLTYENEQSILEKSGFAKTLGLGGAIIWNINEGYFAGQPVPNPLLVATRRAFLEKP
jgi:chitinase